MMERGIQSRIREFFRLYEGEAGKVVLFGLLGAFLQCGIAIGTTAADALFLNHRGAGELPIVYLISPLAIAIYIISHTLLIGRLGIEKVLDLTLVGLALAITAISFLLNSSSLGATPEIYYLLKLTTMVAYVALYTLFWNVADSYFTILDAKRLFAYLSAGCAIGAAAGGALVHWLSSVIRVEELFIVWAVFSLLSLPVAYRIRSTNKKLDTEYLRSDELNAASELRSLGKSFKSSKFSIFITASLFLTLLVSLLCEYQYYGILAAGRNESELAALLGSLSCVVSLINLFINLFLFNRLVDRVGVRNLVLVQPLAYIAVFCFLVVEHSELAALIGFFAYHGLFLSIDGNNFNLLLNALPERERKQLRTFIEGACEPLAHGFVGGGLILVAAALSPAQVSVIGLMLAAGCFILALFLRGSYVSAMIENMRSKWLDFSSAQQGSLELWSQQALKSSDIVRLLRQAPSCSPAERRALERQIGALGSRAVPGCVRALDNEVMPLKSRSIAARVLNRLSFPQLESMANALVNRTLRSAYDTFLWESDLKELELPKPLIMLAAKMSNDKREALIEFMLEILTLSGRLARFEPLAAALRSNEPKSRGTAIEAVEQACSREVRQLLRPLLDEREAESRMQIALDLNGDNRISPIRRLTFLISEGEDVEAAMAMELLSHLDLEKAGRLARQRISEAPYGLSHVVSVDIIGRVQGEKCATIMERAAALLAYPIAAKLNTRAIIAMCSAACVDAKPNTSKSLLLTTSGVEISDSSVSRDGSFVAFDLQRLVNTSQDDPLLAQSLYRLIRETGDGQRALA